jgi:hypothetical protein
MASSSLSSLAVSTALRIGSAAAPLPGAAASAAPPSAAARAALLRAAGASFSRAVSGAAVDVDAAPPRDAAPAATDGAPRRKRSRARSSAFDEADGVRTVFTAGVLDGASASSVGVALVKPASLGGGGTGATLAVAVGAAPPASRELDVSRPAPGKRAREADWFELRAPELTDGVKRELAVLRNRSYLDPKRHYKTVREDRTVPTSFAIGTIVESGGADPSRRLTRSERRPNLVDSLLGDETFRAYATRTMETVRARTEGGGKAAFQAKKLASAAAWKQRRAAFDAEHGNKKSKRKLY